MKAGLVAALEAFEQVANSDRDFNGELYLVVVSGGQDGGTGSNHPSSHHSNRERE